jgi:hypothetical protein
MKICGVIKISSKRDYGKVIGNGTLIGPTLVLTTVNNLLKKNEPYKISFTSIWNKKEY